MFPNLEAEQARRGMTNQSTADILNISRVTYESKKRSGKFYVSEISKLCDLFNCSYEYLFEWHENKSA